MYDPVFDDRGKIFSKVVSKEPLAVIIQTTKSLIRGSIHLHPEQRLSDELNLDEGFLPITSAVVYDQEGKILYESNFLSVSRSQIIWVLPCDDLRESSLK